MMRVVREVARVGWPVAVSYVVVGLACGVLEAQCGLTPAMAFVLGATFLSGSGQFMMSNLWLAGVPMASVLASVAAISSRFALYSASLAPQLSKLGRREGLAVAATFTEEAYGINLDRLVAGQGWGGAHALALNVGLLLVWALSCAAGAAAGAALGIPVAVASFAMTSLFICLALTQPRGRGTACAVAGGVAGVVLCKLAGLAGVAVPLGVLAGVAAGLAGGRRRP